MISNPDPQAGLSAKAAPGQGDAIGPRHAADPGVAGMPPLWSSECLLCGRREIAINHNGTIYRLRATRQGKLILTK